MKSRTLLFGAGQGARQYIANNMLACDVIGFLDNDKTKHGRNFEGLPIYDPHLLHELEYDQVVITTQWALEVQEQLLSELKVDSDKVVLPEKNQLKNPVPFENPKSIELARDIIITLSNMAIAKDVQLVIDFGTLLGIVRDDDVIPWDDDIDFSASVDSEREVELICKSFISKQSSKLSWQLEKLTNNLKQTSGFLIKFTDKNKHYSEFTTSICFRKNEGGNALHMPSLGMWYAPERHFSQSEKLVWRGHNLLVPKDYLEYLSFQYGDWQTPKKNIQLSDYANLRHVSFEDIKKAAMSSELIKSDTKL